MSKHETKLTEDEMKTFLIQQIEKKTGIIIDPKTQCLFQNIVEYSMRAGGDLCIEKKVTIVHENRLHELGSLNYDRFFDEQSPLYNEDITGDNTAIRIFLNLCAKKLKDNTVDVPFLTNNYDYLAEKKTSVYCV